ncbi:MAG TPA: cysteine--tRNA ligase [Candidatus Limnocylindria bacterium]|nr:cysteine--tRNA ligase [Candidatus Limnocylindria bacterium]
MQIYNSQSRRKEDFTPLREGKVGIYCCGPTVYDYFHIGNARPFIMFDVLRRWLEHKGYEVTFVQNFTDVDDKMITRANREGVSVRELGDRFIREYWKDAEALGVRRATVHPRATEHMPQMVSMIEGLIQKGLAYEKGGDVYFHTPAFPEYGKLSGQNLEDLDSGARVSVDEDKRSPLDFALWKAAKPDEPSWDSPWGQGRPGWHIECSAMSMEYLGEAIDIHCGGQDLMFPHHENEVAQSEGFTGHPFVTYWMHNGFINIDNAKMSKSAGNFFTVRDVLKEYDAEDVRMLMLSAHYRSPLNFSRDMMSQARASLARLYNARDKAMHLLQTAPAGEAGDAAQAVSDIAARFDAGMDNDFNTAEAMGAVFELAYFINTQLDETSPAGAVQAAVDEMNRMAAIFGLLTREFNDVPDDVARLAEERAQARKARDFRKSDLLRDELAALGWVAEDTPQGQKLRRA